jgi:hypothetical protein
MYVQSRCRQEISEVKRHSNERTLYFYFMSFMGIYSPLTNIVLVHIFYINETTPRPFHDCDAEGGALVYMWGAKRPPSRRLAIYIGSHPSPNHPPYAQHALIEPTHLPIP